MDSPKESIEILSIGHSNHTEEKFLELLSASRIEVLADVRSVPISAYCPHFNQERLRQTLDDSGIGYVFLGGELGGRPDGDRYYDEDNRVRYDAVAESDIFRRGLERLLEGAKKYRVAMMCSEGSPTHCHRHLLISRVLEIDGIPVTHVLPDGNTRSAADILEADRPTPTLFGQGEQPWISIQSVSRSTAPKSSSAS